jgi:hypothetical protein
VEWSAGLYCEEECRNVLWRGVQDYTMKRSAAMNCGKECRNVLWGEVQECTAGWSARGLSNGAEFRSAEMYTVPYIFMGTLFLTALWEHCSVQLHGNPVPYSFMVTMFLTASW